jgi:hypothetical protein
MSDPLSVVANIIAVIEATDFVLTRCYTYIGRVKNATAEIDRLVLKISLLKGIFSNLHELANGDPYSKTLQDLIRPGGPMAVCTQSLAEIQQRLEASSTKPIAQRKLLWPFEAKKLDEILGRIRQQKPTLLLCLATDNANISRDIRSGVDDIQDILEFTQRNEKLDKILDWLQPFDPSQKHSDARKAHEYGSNQWVLEHPEFLPWTRDAGRNLWVGDVKIFSIALG